ncbi:MAG: CopD family protein [Bacteroidota bacterium]
MTATIILLAKALHVVGFVSWFAGLFYLGRVLVNHAESQTGPVATDRDRIRREVLHEEYVATAQRVKRIIVEPATGITYVAGFTMIGFNPGYLQSGTPGWLWLKIGLVILLTGYQHMTYARLMKPMAAGTFPWSGWQLRLWNEVPTFFLVSIPFIAIFGKVGQLNYLYLGIAVALFCLLVYRGAVAYRKRRATTEA